MSRISNLLARRVNSFRYAACLCLISGAILPLSLAPYGYWPIALLSPIVLALALTFADTRKGVFVLSFLFGLGMFGSGVSWVYVSIHDFGYTGVPLAVLMTFVFVVFLAAIFAIPNAIVFRPQLKYSLNYALCFASVWVLGEWLRSWLFSGFPWLYVGYAHIDTYLNGFAPLAGVFALSFISVANGTLVVANVKAYVENKRIGTLVSCAVSVLAIWSLGFALQHVDWTTKTGDTLSVTILQPNVELEKKWNPLSHPEIYGDLYTQSAQHWDKDIQIWPEAAIPGLYSDATVFIDEIAELAERSHTGIFSGVLFDKYDNTEFEVYNGIAGIGAANGNYFKQKLVPFGEYVPFEKQLRGLIHFFDLPNSVISKGPFQKNALRGTTQAGLDYIISPLICYEIVYPDFVARNAIDADLMFTISNDAWFGKSNGPFQHFEMARMRALESQKNLIRATNTGISGFINDRGKVVNIAKQFMNTTLSHDVELIDGNTPYARTGSWPIIVLCLVTVLVFLYNFQFKRAH